MSSKPSGRRRKTRSSGCVDSEQIEQTKIEVEQAERQYDLNRAAELRYGRWQDWSAIYRPTRSS